MLKYQMPNAQMPIEIAPNVPWDKLSPQQQHRTTWMVMVMVMAMALSTEMELELERG